MKSMNGAVLAIITVGVDEWILEGINTSVLCVSEIVLKPVNILRWQLFKN